MQVALQSLVLALLLTDWCLSLPFIYFTLFSNSTSLLVLCELLSCFYLKLNNISSMLFFPPSEYAQVIKMLGNGRLEAMCFDGVKRLCHIRGKLRKKVGIKVCFNLI